MTHRTSVHSGDGILNDLLAGGYIEVVRETSADDAAPAPVAAERARTPMNLSVRLEK